MRRRRRIKLLATLGPASNTEEKIEQLFLAGADAFRINMSHTPHEDAQNLVKIIRNIEKKHNRPISVLVDLQGPKLRIGSFEKNFVELIPHDKFTLDNKNKKGNKKRVYLPHPEIFSSVHKGHLLLLNDGLIQLKVTKVEEGKIITKVVYGGTLSDRKGVSLPDTDLSVTAMTPKDHKDLDFMIEQDIDWLALSFIQRAEDVAEAKKRANGKARIIAKIEKPLALRKFPEILEVSDGIMVARGDLGVELPIERVPGKQKMITHMSREAGKPVIVATQMLESMINSPLPTRAEVSDVATAVYDGADVVMLSAETAMGKFTVETVEMMNRIAIESESNDDYHRIINSQNIEPQPTAPDAISAAVNTISKTLLNLASIVCYTSSGSTAIRAARERPNLPILALSPVVKTTRMLSLYWGLHAVVFDVHSNLDDMVEKACKLTMLEGFAVEGQRIIITAGIPIGRSGATNMLRIAYVGDKKEKIKI